MSEISQENQKLNPSAIISLFTLDATFVGGPVLRFVQSSDGLNSVVYGGVTYEPIDVEFSGMETSGLGAFPTPKISVSNNSAVVQALVNTYGDLNGCSVSRIRTYERFLDGRADSDSQAFFGPDQYRIERKADDTPEYIEWELSTSIDQEGRQIPGRIIITNTCAWKYRVWDEDAGDFDYSKAQCPYTGSAMYDINDAVVTDGARDKPSRTLNCCKLRFGADQPLPFGGFPGVPRQ